MDNSSNHQATATCPPLLGGQVPTGTAERDISSPWTLSHLEHTGTSLSIPSHTPPVLGSVHAAPSPLQLQCPAVPCDR